MPGGEDSDGPPDAPEDDSELEDAPGNAGGDPSLADKEDSEDIGVDPDNRDYWTFNCDVLVRHHVSPRPLCLTYPSIVQEICQFR